jgi:uncharacterized protein YqgC (DUF456 family)
MDAFNVWLEIIGESLTLVIMLVSLAGLIIPVFPGTVIIWVTALVYGIASGFSTVGIISFVLMSFLALGSVFADNFMMGAKAKENGASWGSILLALGAGVVFTFIFPPIGGLIAAPLVLYVMERQRQGNHEKALATAKALMIGWGWAFVIRFGIGMIMIVLWLIWAGAN